ncbi:MAG: hypothetical protein JW808_05670, partial [Victivallales bacterium]|nr:hypothetical protein [Victivallales bacterium]
MSNRLLTEKVKAEILNFGMDLVGFGPVERWKNAPYLLSPQAILPESKTVVVGAIHITDTWCEMGGEPEPQDRSPGGWMDQNGLLDRTAYRVVRLLNDHGHKAIAVASSNIWRYRQYDGIPSLFAPDLSHIHAAAAAGLAEIGWCGLAITPEFGSRCRFISIVTDAQLVPTPMYDGPKLCDMCGECITHCPSLAMKKDMNAKAPHVVEIGGKVYKYANKNIWRCAWAEHFNLDLNSDTLRKEDHIDEKTILNELHTKGVRGHERGVCQKYCVPPHLRTTKQSFGRDKMIAQNRINKRYPDSMPTLRKMRDDVIARAVELGIDLVAVAPLRTDTDAGKLALKDVPGVQTVFAFAYQIPFEAKNAGNLPQKCGEAYAYPVNLKMHQALLRLARMIEDYGYSAASYTETREACTPELCAMTDLGKIENGEFIIPEFGRKHFTGAITTSAPVDATNRISDKFEIDTPQKIGGRALRIKLEVIAEKNLVSLFGVSPADRLDPVTDQLKTVINEKELGERIVDSNSKLHYHGKYIPKIINEDLALRKPSDFVKGAKSVIVLGMHYPDELIRNAGLEESQQVGCYNFHQYQTRLELCFAAMEVATYLDKMGYKSMLTENLLGYGSYTDSPRGPLPDMRCNSIGAVAAGLGEIGISGALLTKAHGPHQRCICIVTDAEMDYDNPLKAPNVCRKCKVCADKCPMDAISGKSVKLDVGGVAVDFTIVRRHRCDWAKRYSLHPDEGPALIGNNTRTKIPRGEISIEQLAAGCKGKDPIMKSRTCILEPCLRNCPAGSNGKERGMTKRERVLLNFSSSLG